MSTQGKRSVSNAKRESVQDEANVAPTPRVQVIKSQDSNPETDKENAKSLSMHAKIRLEKGQYGEALKDAEWCLNLDPKNPMGHFVAGVSLRYKDFRNSSSDSLVAALTHLTRVVQLDSNLSNYPDLYYHMGVVNEYLSKHKDALQCYNKAMEINPKSQKPRIKLELYHLYMKTE
eukprot:TRINITY_DN6038_c0_g1_i1.p2 TRINITY_DN6038_c0_g1~~TRINITY_DN6038_c0_g1_i1.p2  ORF type:complete len:175 (-),score=30.84 TRINITY_DN6038_c0_g1_i1:701-1225(-)